MQTIPLSGRTTDCVCCVTSRRFHGCRCPWTSNLPPPRDSKIKATATSRQGPHAPLWKDAGDGACPLPLTKLSPRFLAPLQDEKYGPALLLYKRSLDVICHARQNPVGFKNPFKPCVCRVNRSSFPAFIAVRTCCLRRRWRDRWPTYIRTWPSAT